MKLEVVDFLRLVEQANTIAFVDIEATSLTADYGSTLVVSVKPYQSKPKTFVVSQPGHDQKVVREAKEEMEKYDCWVTYYGRGFDVPFLNTRLLKWGLPSIEKRPHLDIYFSIQPKLAMSRKSQAQLLGFLGTYEQKMGLSPNVWSEVLHDPRAMKTLIARCESDVTGLQAGYDKVKHLVAEIKR